MLNEGFCNVVPIPESEPLTTKYIESVNFESPFGFTGRDQSGNYAFILNFSILYKMQGG